MQKFIVFILEYNTNLQNIWILLCREIDSHFVSYSTQFCLCRKRHYFVYYNIHNFKNENNVFFDKNISKYFLEDSFEYSYEKKKKMKFNDWRTVFLQETYLYSVPMYLKYSHHNKNTLY